MAGIKSKLKKLYNREDLSERCGIVRTNGDIVEVDNIHSQPDKGFVIPSEVMITEGVWGTWHTHPDQTSNLSQEDQFGFMQWPDLHHFVVGVDGVREFAVQDGILVEV